jgi:transmembrane 9 superfamily protein 3
MHADVHRVPNDGIVLCALVGTGAQLMVLSLLVIIMAIVSVVYTSPGTLLTYAVLAYALTSFVAGYVSSSLFTTFASLGSNLSHQWMRCMTLTACLFPGTVMLSGFLLNFVAIAYDSAQAIPFGGMIVMLLLWGLVSCPLVVIGTVAGRHGRLAALKDMPRINQIPRIIPARPWYRSQWTFIVGGGILPFGSIFIELYLVFTSFWGYKLYYVYGFMLLVFVILVVVTACVSVVCTYFLVSAEDHRWAWTSFWQGASTAAYVFLYAVYFYFMKTKMTGFFMFAFYFTYMLMLCFGIAILCGTVGYLAASTFIRRIYRNVKTD